MGGIDYHKEVKKLVKEFSEYAKYFDETLQKDDAKHKQLFENHKLMVNAVKDDVKATFVSALSASGILPNKE